MIKSLVFVPRFFLKVFLQVEQCRLFNSLISCRQYNYQQSFIMLARYLSTTIYPAAGRIFFGNSISYKQEIFSCLYGDCHTKYNFGKTMNALLPNLVVVKSVTLFKKIETREKLLVQSGGVQERLADLRVHLREHSSRN